MDMYAFSLRDGKTQMEIVIVRKDLSVGGPSKVTIEVTYVTSGAHPNKMKFVFHHYKPF